MTVRAKGRKRPIQRSIMRVMLPVMLRLHNRRVVIVGGGRVAARKMAGLLPTGALITVISPEFCEWFTSAPALNDTGAGTIDLQQTRYIPGSLATFQPLLVFAATNDPATNRQVIDDAQTLGVLADNVDDAAQSDFHSMAVVQRGLLTLAVSTEGASPALVRHARRRLEDSFGAEYITFSQWLETLRPLVRARVTAQAERAGIWDRLLKSDVLTYLREGKEAEARALVRQISGVDF